MPFEDLQYLLHKYLDNACSAEEKNILAEMALMPENKAYIIQLLEKEWTKHSGEVLMNEEDSDKILQKIITHGYISPHKNNKINPVVPFISKINWAKLSIAASILVIAGLFSYLFVQKKLFNNNIAVTVNTPEQIKAPETNKAILLLGDGTQVSLDKTQQGVLAAQGDIQIKKTASDAISYNGSSSSLTVYNTIINPRGSRSINITLQDGSKVWLNSQSTLKYPVVFNKNERKVEITGEAYFEVAKNPTKKFIVISNGTTTEVSGTHFNVNTYKDDGFDKITLLEGSVKVTNSESSVYIKPGQQAETKATGKIDINNNVALDEIMAWKNGLFNFNSLSLQNIMTQIERWYSVTVQYEGKQSNKHFSGIFSRDDNVSDILKMMQLAGIKFKIEGEIITVYQ